MLYTTELPEHDQRLLNIEAAVLDHIKNHSSLAGVRISVTHIARDVHALASRLGIDDGTSAYERAHLHTLATDVFASIIAAAFHKAYKDAP